MLCWRLPNSKTTVQGWPQRGDTVPYGFRLEDGQVIPDDEEQTVVALVGSLRASGASLREIARTCPRPDSEFIPPSS